MSSVKTEALLLFCRDLINTYKDENDSTFGIDEKTKVFIDENIKDLNKAINVVIQSNEYYIKNHKVSRIRIIVKFYNDINKIISTHLSNDTQFSPAMLCFSLLATWFKELEHDKQSKEYLYFSLYPYSDIFDMLIINTSSNDYKNLNINMIQIAEDTMIKLNAKGLND